jgi:extracellular elastinolytic metalloproteinase
MTKHYPIVHKTSLTSTVFLWGLRVGLSLASLAPALAQTRPQAVLPGGLTLLPAVASPRVVSEGAALAYQTHQQWAGHEVAAADLRISNSYTDAHGLTYTYVQQLHAGIPVYNQLVTLVFKDGKLRHHAGAFVGERVFAGVSAKPAITASTATAQAVTPLATGRLAAPVATGRGVGPEQRQTFAFASVSRRELATNLVWVFDAQQRPHLAWNVNVELRDSPDWLNIRIDAATGQKIDQDNWTVYEAPATVRAAGPNRMPRTSVQPATRSQSQLASPLSSQAVTSASYRVVPFPGERPDVTTPRVNTDPWLRAGASNPVASYGWHFDGTTNYTDTRGNNVWAYDDSLNQNVPGRFTVSTGTSSSLVFNDMPDFTQVPTLGKNRRAATTNLFYWNNLMHDVMYQYGFTEATGNFQTDNQGRGGMGGDYVRAEAQDGGGTNNANFATPPDGTGGRMQMYLWTGITPIYTINVTAPAAVARNYVAVESGFSTNNKLATLGPISGQLALYADAGSSPVTYLACGTYGGTTPLAGKIAVLYRGVCSFAPKVKNAQLAGAIAAIVINNAPGAPTVMGGTDNTITIPSVMISQDDGATLVAQIANGVQVTLPKPTPTGPQLDGDFDSGVMSHEYGHGISNRLTGGGTNTSCLNNAEEAGEGWSDYFGLMMTTDWTTAQTTDGAKARPVGAYVYGQTTTGVGLRRYPYSTSLSVNPLTYANVASNPEVHAIGEVWTATLWDMTWNIIQQQGAIEPNLYNSASTGGNAVALNLVMQGLKLQPCQPGFLDSRDAILAADSLLYGGQYHCSIWSAFARRGMGFSAREGASTSATDQTVAYDQPGVTLRKHTTPLVGNQFTITLAASCDCQPTSSVSITDQLPAGLQYVSSSGGTLSGNTVTFSGLSFTKGQQRTFQIVAQAATGAGCPIVMPVNDDRETNTLGGFTPAVVTAGGSNAWAPTTALAHSGTTSWAAGDPNAKSDVTLTSAAFTPTGFSLLSFYHFFSTESIYDGGMVAISVNNGAWQDAASYFLQNGYNSVFTTGTASAGKPCFSGISSELSGPAAFQQSVLNLTSFSGQSIRVRFQFQSDEGNPYNGLLGWFIDDVQVQNGCGGLQQVQLLNSAGTVTGSYAQATFLTVPAPTLTAVAPNPGGLGQVITLTGLGLGSPTALNINGADALAGIISNDGSTLVVRVPLGAAAAGTVSLTTALGKATLPFSVMAAPGNALAFDGTDDYLALPLSTPVPVGNAAYTVEAWVNPNAMDLGSIIGWGDYGTTNQANGLSLNQTGLINYWWANDLQSPTPSLVGRWHHVAATYDGTTRTLYLDGVALGADVPGEHSVPDARNLRIGSNSNGNFTFLNGRLDEVRVYSVALTPAQLRADMTSTTASVPASLVLYYNFDQGTPATAGTGDNAPYTTLYDLSSNATPATLTGFALASGNTSSNYVQSYALVVPAATAATSQTSTSFIATWTAPVNGTATSYLLDVSTTPDFASPVTGSPFSAAAPATSYGVTGLTQNTTYYYRVRALNSALATADQGAFSNTSVVATPLPVKLVSFTATAQSRTAVRLAWATASELNSRSFEVERSLDGASFQLIGAVAAAGTTPAAHTYGLLDATLPSGTTLLYYRLRQVDQDGSANYSVVRSVTVAGASVGLSLYPNPVHGGAATLTGAVPGTRATVLDALGRSVFSALVDATGTATLALPPGLAAGVYIVRAGAQALRLTVE